ncbi:3-oxoacyl-[acyl-carrier-protein] reductase FabG-like [Spodoptera frugiperda]|uniref:3-oxoacyl-[acyl-carrier-protein] reductase FabG-like n=1 Tax=Spodoptera frugiperda TaxID=7108 RepID=A0A9R0EKG5_SPOFR|nr:3-oxoacyl-[acyl-carrier-protein] reductase FabG-like [Spodoptera frugiperda]
MSFQDKVVIVTGASSGIGAATAIKFAEEGAKVVLVGRNQEKLNNVSKKCGNPLIIAADVSKDEDAKRVIEETLRYFGGIDVLVNNAGIGSRTNIQDKDVIPVFDRIMSTNLRAVVVLTHLAVPHLVKSKGNIVNVSSVAGYQVFQGSFAYCTSKAGLDHFTRAVALELAPHGVRVNAINPGPVRTDILENMGITKEIAEATFDRMRNTTALQRVSESDEVADLILFIASDKSKAITGSSIVTDNGTLLKGNSMSPLEE